MEKPEDPKLTQAKKDVAKLKEQMLGIFSSKNDVSLAEAAKDSAAIQKLTLKPRRLLKGHLAKVYDLQWCSDKSHIVSAAQDGKLLVWDAMTQNKVYALGLRCNWVLCCGYSQNGGLVAAGGLDNVCAVFNLRSREPEKAIRQYRDLNGHTGYISCCQFLNDREIITTSGDNTCILWDIDSSQKKQNFVIVIKTFKAYPLNLLKNLLLLQVVAIKKQNYGTLGVGNVYKTFMDIRMMLIAYNFSLMERALEQDRKINTANYLTFVLVNL